MIPELYQRSPKHTRLAIAHAEYRIEQSAKVIAEQSQKLADNVRLLKQLKEFNKETWNIQS
jgi:hypothetical protein